MDQVFFLIFLNFSTALFGHPHQLTNHTLRRQLNVLFTAHPLLDYRVPAAHSRRLRELARQHLNAQHTKAEYVHLNALVHALIQGFWRRVDFCAWLESVGASGALNLGLAKIIINPCLYDY